MFDPSKNLKKMLGPNINIPSYKRGKKVNDLDGDGIPNWKDCQPENMFRQDFGKTDIAHLSYEKHIELFKAGKKPILLLPIDLPGYNYIVGGQSWIKYDDKTGKKIEEGPKDRIYYHDGKKKDALRLRSLIKYGNKNDPKYHYEIGKLLGYSKNEVERFISRSSKFK